MDSGIAALIAATIATTGTLAGTWLNDYLAKQKTDPANQAAKSLLLTLLQSKDWEWRSLETLANVIGLDEPATRRLLLEIGARGSEKNGRLWGLVSRNPISVEMFNLDP